REAVKSETLRHNRRITVVARRSFEHQRDTCALGDPPREHPAGNPIRQPDDRRAGRVRLDSPIQATVLRIGGAGEAKHECHQECCAHTSSFHRGICTVTTESVPLFVPSIESSPLVFPPVVVVTFTPTRT